MKKSTRRWLGLGATAVVLGLIIYNLTRSPDWRDFDWNRLWLTLVHARREYLLGGMAASLFSYLVRAYRWRFFMYPIKKASLWSLFAAQVLGFAAIYLVGRPGEFVRPAYIARKEGVPISSMLAIWVLERVYDTVFMVLLFALALRYAPLRLTGPHAPAILNALHRASHWMMLVMALAVVILVFIRLRAESLVRLFANRLGFLPRRVRGGLKNGFYSFAKGLDVIRNWRDLLASLVSSAVLWIVNIGMVWFVLHSLGGSFATLTFMSSGLVLFCAALGLFVQLPGVGGGYQVGAIVALRRIFMLHHEGATGAAILMWMVTLIPCLVLGLLILLYEGLTFKKLGAIAKEEREAMEEKV